MDKINCVVDDNDRIEFTHVYCYGGKTVMDLQVFVGDTMNDVALGYEEMKALRKRLKKAMKLIKGAEVLDNN